MGFFSIFERPQSKLPDSDFADLTTEILVYQPSDEFAEPHMPVPVVPVMRKRTSDQGGKQ